MYACAGSCNALHCVIIICVLYKAFISRVYDSSCWFLGDYNFFFILIKENKSYLQKIHFKKKLMARLTKKEENRLKVVSNKKACEINFETYTSLIN